MSENCLLQLILIIIVLQFVHWNGKCFRVCHYFLEMRIMGEATLLWVASYLYFTFARVYALTDLLQRLWVPFCCWQIGLVNLLFLCMEKTLECKIQLCAVNGRICRKIWEKSTEQVFMILDCLHCIKRPIFNDCLEQQRYFCQADLELKTLHGLADVYLKCACWVSLCAAFPQLPCASTSGLCVVLQRKVGFHH